MKAFHMLTGAPWAITTDALKNMLRIASRDEALQAVQKQSGEKLAYTRTVTVRNGVAIIPVEGPIFRYANLFSEMSGATSIEVLAQDINRALTDTSIKAILLNIDSPGGEVNGTNELAQIIYEARQIKPVHAYVGGLGCSAGYWVASACQSITCDATAILGSIGVVLAVPNPDAQGAEDIEFVSSKSPKKRPDVTTDEGKGEIQQVIDTTADVFIDTVARNRGRTAEQVAEEFGQGGVFVGQRAVSAGLADKLGSFEQTLAELGGDGPMPSSAAARRASTKQTNALGIPAQVAQVDYDAFMKREHVPLESSIEILGAHAQKGAALLSAIAGQRQALSQGSLRMEDEQVQADTKQTAPVVPPTPPTDPGVVPIAFDDPQMQAEIDAYKAQMSNQYKAHHEATMRQVREESKLEFARQRAEWETQQAITAWSQHATTPTLSRPHALPGAAEDYTKMLNGLNGEQRKSVQGAFDRVLTSGLVNFEEFGTSAEGDGARTAQERWDDAIAAKVKGGLSRSVAITAVMNEQPALYREYSNAGKKGKRS